MSFDGQVLRIPPSCDLVLAADVTKNTFAITLKSDWTEKHHTLMVQLQNTSITVRPKEEVCTRLTSFTPFVIFNTIKGILGPLYERLCLKLY